MSLCPQFGSMHAGHSAQRHVATYVESLWHTPQNPYDYFGTLLLSPSRAACYKHTSIWLQAEEAKGQVKSSWNQAKGQAQETVDGAKDSFKSNFSEDTRAKAEQSKKKASQAADDASDSIRVRAKPLPSTIPSRSAIACIHRSEGSSCIDLNAAAGVLTSAVVASTV